MGGEYGRMPIIIEPGSTLYSNRPASAGDRSNVWMSHGDEAAVLPPGFKCVGRSEQGAVVAIEDPARRIYGLQYHPEVMHSEGGTETIKHFLLDVSVTGRMELRGRGGGVEGKALVMDGAKVACDGSLQFCSCMDGIHSAGVLTRPTLLPPARSRAPRPIGPWRRCLRPR